MASRRVTVPLRSGSDGDATHRPTNPKVTLVDPPTLYLEKIGTQWMKSRGEHLPGISYSLHSLPAGYALYQRPRDSDPKHVDKWLYGHPRHKVFDSPNRFFPHFKYLVDNQGDSMGCPCTVCNAKGGTILPMSNSVSGTSTPNTTNIVPKIAPKVTASAQSKGKFNQTGFDTTRVDEEGTPDVYRNLINKLKKNHILDEIINEPLSLDWRAEQVCLPALKGELDFVPRIGDIVLFVRRLPEGVTISRHRKSGMFKLYDHEKKMFLDHPDWEAGFVGQVPAETTRLEDIVHEPSKTMNVSISGLRVEPLPHPNGTDKSLSKRYQYVPLHHTRPFVLWKDYLSGINKDAWHPTITNALSLMATFSLVNKHRFRGQWPDASIYCDGIFIGSELLAVGDTVRLLPKKGDESCTDVLVIKSIRLQLTNLDKASDNDYDEGRPYNSEIYVFGQGYTMSQHRSSKECLVEEHDKPKVMDGYEVQHPLHPSDKEIMVPFSRILGRLYSAEAMTLWLPSLSNADGIISPQDIDQGREGILQARSFARAHDTRIVNELGANWYWGDHRADSLDLGTINGLDVNSNQSRDPQSWRAMLHAISDQITDDSAACNTNRLQGFWNRKQSNRSGRPSSSSTTNGEDNSSNSAFRKRVKVTDLSSGEDELQNSAKLIHDPSDSRKKPRISVLIE